MEPIRSVRLKNWQMRILLTLVVLTIFVVGGLTGKGMSAILSLVTTTSAQPWFLLAATFLLAALPFYEIGEPRWVFVMMAILPFALGYAVAQWPTIGWKGTALICGIWIVGTLVKLRFFNQGGYGITISFSRTDRDESD